MCIFLCIAQRHPVFARRRAQKPKYNKKVKYAAPELDEGLPKAKNPTA
jgi:hypothetical protein